ncbi:MAG TPA: DsbA family protein [Kofleriaceae bacterium]|nr:DsbA family protein [Kofleriaceae bacterium]
MRVGPTLEALLEQYPKDLKIVFKHFVVHPQHATIPATAACAADKQGKFHEMYKLIWEKGFSAGRNLSQENMEKLAGELGLNMAKFKADQQGECAKKVRQDQQDMAKIGVGGTPAFFINGRFLSGARPIEQFKALIDEELKKANERIGKDGTTAANYYEKWVLEKGKKSL